MKIPFSVLLLCVAPFVGLTADYPNPDAVADSMRKATNFFHENLAVRGGYATEWPLDHSSGRTEHSDSPTVISIQPHGTTTVGMAMLKAYQATGDPVFLSAAREAASALQWCQLASGGWTSDFDFNPDKRKDYHFRRDVLAGDTDQGKRKATSTLDDNKTQSALLFLLELSHQSECAGDEDLQSSAAFAFDGLFAAQFPNGAWTQQFSGPADAKAPVKKAAFPDEWPRDWPNEKYSGFYTLNDNNLLHMMGLLLRASELTGEPIYLERAKRLGDFLLLAQHAEPQPGWSQQYNLETEAVWARKFEPPALCSGESLGAVETLFSLWIATGDEKYRETIPTALDWLSRSQLDDGRWARFYEFTTNRPLYCEADTYKVTYDDSSLPTHYGFKLDASFGRKIERYREDLERPRESLQRSRKDPDNPESWAKMARGLKSKVEAAMKAQTRDGYWADGDTIDAGLFVKHMNAMALYTKAVKNAGEAFPTSQK